jgi:hypothetical protein
VNLLPRNRDSEILEALSNMDAPAEGMVHYRHIGIGLLHVLYLSEPFLHYQVWTLKFDPDDTAPVLQSRP